MARPIVARSVFAGGKDGGYGILTLSLTHSLTHLLTYSHAHTGVSANLQFSTSVADGELPPDISKDAAE